MKNKKTIKPTRSRFNVLRQICNLIPEHEVSKIARETGVDDRARTFSPWSHTVSLLDAQLTHCIGLNDLCDSLQLHSGPLSTIRGATPPSPKTSAFRFCDSSPRNFFRFSRPKFPRPSSLPVLCVVDSALRGDFQLA